MSPLLQQALAKLRMVEMQYVICVSALDMLGFILTHEDAQVALGQCLNVAQVDVGIDETEAVWDYIALHLPGVQEKLFEPVHKSALAPGQRDHFYAFVYFSYIRDLCMVMKVYLRTRITTSYLSNETSDHSWFTSWRDFCVYTNIDIESVPEAPAIAQLFGVDDQLACRDFQAPDATKFGVLPAVEASRTTQVFLTAVDAMVEHDLVRRKQRER